MRLASLLPMLLLAFSIPVAGQNCQIFDLTATVVQVNPINCQFFISLDFEFNGTSNQFNVSGNGNSYGLFTYNQVPLVLGPFNGNPNAPTQLEFVVTDAVFPGCSDQVMINVPPCNNQGICNIENLIVAPGPCDPLGLTYSLLINFQVTGAVNNTFEVFAGGGISLGVFPVAALPVLLPAFPASGNPQDVITVCISNQPNCCEVLQFDAPPCANGGCNIVGLTAQTGDCTSDSTYKVTIDFDILGAPTADSFAVWSNGQFLGLFGLNQLPLTQEVLWGGDNIDEIKVCLANINVVCCRTVEFHAPPCLFGPPCGINGLLVKKDGCTSDSTFKAFIDFTVNDPSGVDSFDLWINGTYWGPYGMNQLPLAIDSFPWNGLIFSNIKVCTGNLPGCCKELQFLNPACLPYGPCEITDIFVQTGECTSDSTYKVTINFNGTNPGDGLFTVSIHNQLIDTFPLTDVPLMLEVPWHGLPGDFIQICILDSTASPTAPGCCGIKQFTVPACLFPCKIVDVVIDPGGCNPDQTFNLFLDFETLNATSDSFEVWGNGQYLGAFALSALPLNIGNFPSNGNAIDVLKICLKGNDDCCHTLEFQGPNCNQNCEIFDVVLDPGDCNTADNVFQLHLDFEVQNPGSDSFEVWGNGQYLGLYALSDLPLTLFNFPSNGNAIDVIRICIQGNPNCCKTLDFQGPDCNPPCEIFDLVVDTGDCDTLNGTYEIKLNFQVQNPGSDSFELWGNGQYLGVFALNSLPLQLSNMPSNGNAIDIIKVCIQGNPDCCRGIDFQGPNCDPLPCSISNVVLTPGACNPNHDSYALTIDFDVINPGNALFEVWGNGQYLGLFPLAGLPVVIQQFPNNGNAIDVIKICINDHPDCCVTLDFQGPNCDLPCEIFNLGVDTGNCNPADSTYEVWVNFQVQNPPSDLFGLWANGQFLGNYNLNQLPLYIPNFPWDGVGVFDVIKVCMVSNNGALSCCRTIEFPTPNCFQNNCDITDLVVEIGDCTSDSTYQLWMNFNVANPPANTFGMWANGQFFGVFNLADLPLTFQFFPWDGGQTDFLKVCFTNAPGGPGACCEEIDFHVPDCLFGAPCDIFDLTATPGPCNPATGTYPLTVNFQVNNPGNDFFKVWVNGTFYGTHLLTALPFTIPNVPSNGIAADEIKVCINDHPDCCESIAFLGPNCNVVGNCEIFNVVLDPGDCNPATNTYELLLDFDVVNPSSDFFEVWGNNVYLGAFPLANLPLWIPNFPNNGPAIDVIKICIKNDPNCCRIIEFQGPNCVGGLCDIFDFSVVTGNCTSDSTYNVTIDFEVINATGNFFQVWANGQLFGQFNLGQLPLLIQDFPWDGGNTDNIKVCLMGNIPGNPPCCEDRTFQVPDCLGDDDCHIYDLVVVRTPCLCGQFFVALTFEHENGGAGGFDIVGNGNFYGNFPYDTIQPIILGPFPGDGTTMYEFAVVDHDHPDLCGDDFNLGKVECMTPITDPGAGTALMTLSPNPTSNWLNVTAMLENAATIGQANVQVYAADGRLALSNTVANGANFQLDVTNLPAGMYRLVLISDTGRLEGKFAKQ